MNENAFIDIYNIVEISEEQGEGEDGDAGGSAPQAYPVASVGFRLTRYPARQHDHPLILFPRFN
jgi:hypothetical protein